MKALGAITATGAFLLAAATSGCGGRIARIEENVDALQRQVAGFEENLTRQNTRLEKTFDDLDQILGELRKGGADVLAEMSGIRDQLAVLKGTNEELVHHVRLLREGRSGGMGSSAPPTFGLPPNPPLDSHGAGRPADETALAPRAATEPQPRGSAGGEGETLSPSQQSPTPAADAVPPGQAYRQAYADFVKGQYQLAIAEFQNFLSQYPGDEAAPNAQYWIAECYYSLANFEQARREFDRVASDYAESEKVPDAMLKSAYSQINLGDHASARAQLQRLIEDYDNTHAATLARQKLREISQ